MANEYTECMISVKSGMREKILKADVIVITALGIILGTLFHPIFLLLVPIGVLLMMFVVPKLQKEYEYLFISGDLDIDVIYSRKSRKKVGSYPMKQLEVMAPVNSSRLDAYRNNTAMKRTDCTSRDPEAAGRQYACVFAGENGREMLLFEPDEKMVKEIRMRMPGKVFLQ